MLKENDYTYESLKNKYSEIQEEKQVFETATKEIAEFEQMLEKKLGSLVDMIQNVQE